VTLMQQAFISPMKANRRGVAIWTTEWWSNVVEICSNLGRMALVPVCQFAEESGASGRSFRIDR
jgi:hypothetical protein